ncbi:MAG TPA: L,D-transpeptidase family protein [Bauldia sp.]|nr:L,D-transpeptidase family protein [Bauldia sp.]
MIPDRIRSRHLGPLLVLLGLVLAAAPACAEVVLTPADRVALRAEIVNLLATEPELPLPVRQRSGALTAYYSDGARPILWLGEPRASDFVAWLRNAADDGLDPAAYPADQLDKLMAAAPETNSRGKAIVELHFSAAFLQYASDLQVGRFLPHKVDPDFFQEGRSIDQLGALTLLSVAENLDRFFLAWQPQAPEYADLRAALADYRALAAAGGWPTVPLGESLKPGMTDPRVPALRARLAVTDGADLAAPPGSELVYDDALAAVVKAFQARHGLDVDGIVGKATIVALNVPVETRVRDIVLSMERWRWMPPDLGRNHLIVNIAGFELKRIADGRVEERMNVVVGRPYNKTPVFSDAVRYLEFNPYWNVPHGIAVKEELPKLKQNPAARAAAGFEAVRGSEVYPVTAIDWNRYGPGNFPFQLRQKPGPGNALGRVKFMFPNRFDVYLHDTPARSLFDKAERAFSHGCIRLARPLDLAVQVLAVGGVPGWDMARIEAVVTTRQRTVVNLAEPLTVHITYFTAWVDRGIPNFRADIYGQDQKLDAALDGQPLAW